MNKVFVPSPHFCFVFIRAPLLILLIHELIKVPIDSFLPSKAEKVTYEPDISTIESI